MAFQFLKKKPAAKSKTEGLGIKRSDSNGLARPTQVVAPVGQFTLKRAASAFKQRRADFYEDLAEALEDRAVLVDELKKLVLRERARRSAVAHLYAVWLKRMDTLTFSNAMKGYVPALDSLILMAAESSGQLPPGLRFLATTVRSVGQIKSAIMGAVAVPLIVTSMLLGMLFGFGKFMVPILLAILPVEHWPTIGRFMYSIAMAFTNYGILIFAGIGASIFGFIWALPNWVGNTRRKFDNFLPFSVYRDYNSAVMLVSLSGLMQSGSSLVGSLRSMRTASPPWLAWHITKVLYNLDRESAEPAKAFGTGVLPEDLYDRVIDYGQRSSFQSALNKIGAQALTKVEKTVALKARVLNSLLLAVSGTMLALMIGSVMMTAQQARIELATQSAGH